MSMLMISLLVGAFWLFGLIQLVRFFKNASGDNS